MKSMMGTFLILFLFLSCNTNDIKNDLPNVKSFLIGKWQLTATYISPGGITEWENIPNGFRYIFDNQGYYKRTSHEDVLQQNGRYQIDENELFLFFETQQEKDTLGYSVELKDEMLILSPSYPTRCIEGCLYRFEKIK